MTHVTQQFIGGLVATTALTFSIGAFAQATPAPPATPSGHQHGHRGEKLKQLDTNGDGALSKAEVAGKPRLAQRFDQIDANKDGQITPDEMKAARAAHKGEHGGQRPQRSPS